ncbi:hypothetical protein BU15DRAFT_77076 [Melanogaster broomeanus]|nr:hypothetical protein BU15DRAFT_77076 [Melanogaster broomeanus]
MQEFEQGQGWSGASSSSPPSDLPPDQAQAQGQGSYYPSYASVAQQGQGQTLNTQQYQGAQSGHAQRQTSQSYPVHTSSPSWSNGQPRTNTYAFASPSVPRPEPRKPDPPQSYYHPDARGDDLYGEDEDEGPFTDIPNPASSVLPYSSSAAAAPPTSGSTATPPPSSSDTKTDASTYASNERTSSSPPARVLSAAAVGSSVYVPPGVTGPSAAGAGPARPPSTGSGTPPGVDFSACRARSRSVHFVLTFSHSSLSPLTTLSHTGKLGLLPKRPISLVAPANAGAGAGGSNALRAPAPSMGREHSESTTEDSDEPEYVENPFEGRT